MKKKYTAAVCQMDSNYDKQQNLQTAAEMIREAAAHGASLAVFPETMNYIGPDLKEQAETIPGPTTDLLCRAASQHRIWVVSGSIQERQKKGNPQNTLVLIDPNGKIICSYSKLHLFDADPSSGQIYRESADNSAGSALAVQDTELGRLGFAICYDLRFGEMFRLMALQGAQVICLPACFTTETGKDHWEVLLRARAIENGVFILAADQIGAKDQMNAYGRSMIVDPWGNVLAQCGDCTGLTYAEIDLEYEESVRRQLPSLKNRRSDLYQIIYKGRLPDDTDEMTNKSE